ncbi:MAG: protein kinase domain-containing protein [Fimbriiglobus sp.]
MAKSIFREIQLIEKIGQGGFADVWKGKDRLGRLVAIKIVRDSAAAMSDALAHAEALARASHPNVVTVHYIDKVYEPESELILDCVVMELLEGVTLEAMFRSLLTSDEVSRIGLGVIAGLEHLHSRGITHGDLHCGNVMIGNETVKLIDILYRESLAELSTGSREERMRRDVTGLLALLRDLIRHSNLDPKTAGEFDQKVASCRDVGSVREVFSGVVALSDQDDLLERIETALQRLKAEHFPEGERYATALIGETPRAGYCQVLERLATEREYRPAHKDYVKLLWSAMEESEREQFCKTLGKQLEADTPNGNWPPALRIAITDKQIWKSLPELVRLRVESLITADVLKGRYELYGKGLVAGGLGTFSLSLWQDMSDRTQLFNNLIRMLQGSTWSTQNYVGYRLLGLVARLSSTPETKKQAIDAIVEAVQNDAKIVIQNLDKLPSDWIVSIRRKAKKQKS